MAVNEEKKLRHLVVVFRNPREAWRFQKVLEGKGFKNEFDKYRDVVIALMLSLDDKRILPVKPNARKLLGLDGSKTHLYGNEVLQHRKDLIERQDRRVYLKLLKKAKEEGFRVDGITFGKKEKKE